MWVVEAASRPSRIQRTVMGVMEEGRRRVKGVLAREERGRVQEAESGEDSWNWMEAGRMTARE